MRALLDDTADQPVAGRPQEKDNERAVRTATTTPADTTTVAAADQSFNWPTGMLVLIPVFNHAGQVADVVCGARALGAPVLVVDDGSTDGSGTVAAEAGAEVITLPVNQGKAAALKRGLEEGERRGYQQVLSCDADGQHPTSEVRKLADVARQAPRAIVIGERDMHVAPFLSRLGRLLSNTSTRILCGVWPGDSQSGLRVYPVPAINQLAVPAKRYAFEVEVLIRGVWAGLHIEAVPVKVLYPQDRVTHFNKLRDNFHATRVLLRLLGRRLLPVPHKRVDLVAEVEA